MKRLMLVTMAALSLAACDAPDSPEYQAQQKARCEPEWIATAPDGTTLWAVSQWCERIPGAYPVYFSSRGTQTGETHGKQHREQVVPNGQ